MSMIIKDVRPKRISRVVGSAGWLLAATGFGASGARADPQGLSTNVPVQIEDAFPATEQGQAQIQWDGVYQRDPHDSGGTHAFTTGPTLKLGLLPHSQVDINPGYTAGDSSSANQGTTSLDALVQLRGNDRFLPALAVHMFYEIPYGAGHKSAQYTLRGVATKYLGASKSSPRLHLNLSWVHVTQPDRQTRRDQLAIAGGLSFLVGHSTAMVVDAAHGAAPTSGENRTFVDVGVIHEFGESWSIGIGGGAGLAQQSPQARVFLSTQYNFGLF
jgi:hypothetical protein